MNSYDQDQDDQYVPDLNGEMKRRPKARACRFCEDKALVIDYKDTKLLKSFISDRGKLTPRRITGNCALHQRKVTTSVKQARNIALLPFTVTH